jgi:hypothetical protein
MLVKLVVVDSRDYDTRFGECCGCYVYDFLTESFIGDDRRPKPVFTGEFESVEAMDAEQAAHLAWERYHFPNYADSEATPGTQELSREYLATMVLGSTGWSGWHTAEQRYWECTVDALTPEGLALYRALEVLYPGCELHLLTFLDT